jgi:hypothetical protein
MGPLRSRDDLAAIFKECMSIAGITRAKLKLVD